MAAHADVLIENFKVGGLAKYGLDFAALREVNPRLVYCSISGFGQDGPYAARAGYDFMIQGMGGIMDLTGAPDGEPQKIGVAFADIFTGVYAAVAIQAALRQRDETGKGCHIDMALLDVQVGVLANQALNYLASGAAPRRMGNAHPNIVPYQVLPVSDGHVIVAVGNDGQFGKFSRVIGAPRLAADKRFTTNAQRVSNREALAPLISELTAKMSREELLSALEAAGRAGRADQQRRRRVRGPAGRVPRHADRPAAARRQGRLRSRRARADRDRRRGGGRRSAPAPALGAHTAEILADPNWGGGE